MKKKLFLLVLTLSLVILTACGKQKIELSQYASINVSGYDGYGKATINVDWSSLEDVVLKDEKESFQMISKISQFSMFMINFFRTDR